MNSASQSVLIHQTLHGYRDGHRLLASSLPLNREDQQVMLALSDTADFRFVSDFPRLLTGYPLPSAAYYTLAMTWPAPEQSRPGCVWTHSLLLDHAALRNVRDPEALLSIYQRPDISDADLGGSYTDRVVHDARDAGQRSSIAEDLLPTIVWALYEPPTVPVSVQRLPLDPDSRERLLMRLWGQQWSSLRQQFAFAEAPSTARYIAGRPFDLQFTHSPQAGISMEDRDHRVVRGPLRVQPPRWCHAVADDATTPSELSDFLCDWGPEIGAGRETLAALARIWTVASQHADTWADDLVRTIETVLPNDEHNQALIRALLGADRVRSVDDELALLRALLGAPKLAADAGDLAIRDRASAIATTANGAKSLLTSLAESPSRSQIAKEIATGLTRSARDQDLREFNSEHADLGPGLLKRHPQLATRRGLWEAGDADALWAVLRTSRVARNVRGEIVEALAQTETDVDPQDVLARWPDASQAVLALLSSGELRGDASAAWVQAIPPDQLVSWLPTNPASAGVLSALASNWECDKLARMPTEAWRGFASIAEALPGDAAVRVLAGALAGSGRDRDGLAMRLYDRLYPEAVGKQMGTASRDLLRKLAPGVPTTDPARQLARAINRAVSHGLRVDLALGLTSEAAFTALLREDSKGSLTRDLASRIAAQPSVASYWQKEAVRQAKKKDARGGLAKGIEDALEFVKRLG